MYVKTSRNTRSGGLASPGHLPPMSEEASGAVLDVKAEKPLVTFEGESEANRIVQELMSLFDCFPWAGANVSLHTNNVSGDVSSCFAKPLTGQAPAFESGLGFQSKPLNDISCWYITTYWFDIDLYISCTVHGDLQCHDPWHMRSVKGIPHNSPMRAMRIFATIKRSRRRSELKWRRRDQIVKLLPLEDLEGMPESNAYWEYPEVEKDIKRYSICRIG